jgi:hypothetical protein
MYNIRMKLPAVFLITILYLALTSPVQAGISNYVRASSNSGSGGNSTTQVNIKNNVNTGGSVNSYKSETKTDVHISQEGEGTSSVTINGKEWKLEGPGEINVDENTDSVSSTPTPAPTDTPDPTSTPTETPTPTPAPTGEILGDQDNTSTTIGKLIEDFMKSLREIFSKMFTTSNAVITGSLISGL